MAKQTNKKVLRRKKIRYRIRKKIEGTAERPRLAVFRSNKYIYAQIIDDVKGHTLTNASSKEATIDSQKLGRKDAAKEVGKAIAERAKSLGIDTVVFDRGGYLYHGRVAAVAEGAREIGLVL